MLEKALKKKKEETSSSVFLFQDLTNFLMIFSNSNNSNNFAFFSLNQSENALRENKRLS